MQVMEGEREDTKRLQDATTTLNILFKYLKGFKLLMHECQFTKQQQHKTSVLKF